MIKLVLCILFLQGCAYKTKFEMNGNSPFWIELGAYNNSDMTLSISNTIRTKFKYRNNDFSDMLESEIENFAIKFCGLQEHEFLSSKYEKIIRIKSHQENEYPYLSTLTKVVKCK